MTKKDISKKDNTEITRILKSVSVSEVYIKKKIKKHNKGERSPIDYAKILSISDLNINRAMIFIAEQTGKTIVNVKRTADAKALKYMSDNYITDEIRKYRAETKKKTRDDTKKRNTQSKIIKEQQNILSFFSIKTDGLEKELAKLKEGENRNDKSFLEELYELRLLFMAKAKGEITTQQTDILWEVDEENGKIIKRNIYIPKSGKQTVSIKTQSHLPSEQALVGVRIVDEIIMGVESRERTEMNEDELKELYSNVKKKAEQQRLEYTDVTDEILNNTIDAEIEE